MDNFADIARKIRRSLLKNSFSANACHLGSALSCVEILVYLYWQLLKDEDIFIFSKASGVAALYSVLAEKGIIPKSKIAYYLKNYPLISKEVPGVIWSGGSLGHGLPVAVGMALANRKRRVYCLMSDAEIQEGTTWESALFAAQHQLDNLFVFVDMNGLQACGRTKDILDINPIEKKFKSFGWKTFFVNGHNFEAIDNVFINKGCDGLSVEWRQFEKETPKVIILNTIKGKGIDFIEDDFEWHYRNLNKELLKKALKCQI